MYTHTTHTHNTYTCTQHVHIHTHTQTDFVLVYVNFFKVRLWQQKAKLSDLKILLSGQNHLQLLVDPFADAGLHVAHGGQVAEGDAHLRTHLIAVHLAENVQTLTVGVDGFVDVSPHGVHLTQLVKGADQVA